MTDELTIDFGDMLDISFAAKFHAQLKESTKENGTVHLSTENLIRIDSSCLQVLTAFIKYAKENKIAIKWNGSGDVIKESARLLGLTEILELSVE